MEELAVGLGSLRRPSILVLDDEPSVGSLLSRFLEKDGMEVLVANSVAEANSLLATVNPDVAIVDVFLGTEDGLEYVRDLRSRRAELGIVVISAEDTEILAAKAIDSGADYFLSKPVAPAALRLTVRRLFELHSQREKTVELERELERSVRDTVFPGIVTNCDAMRAVLRLVEKIGPRDLSVFICGESGTGKELIARAIHQQSNRAKGNFVELNCAALPPNLVESELFGHEKGSFTGAVASRVGKIQLASEGTLFLDEIGELPLDIQPKLLRALQEKRIVPVGGKQAISCDFRLISATNRDLIEEVRAGRFREDLFYRIAVFPIKLPSLRDRMEDLEILLSYFLRMEGIERPEIAPEARAILHQHHWPGNVRELKNFAQAITLFAEDGVVDEPAVRAYFGSRLEMWDSGPATAVNPGNPGSGRRPPRSLPELEKQEILYALEYHKGNVSEAARSLQMGRATLYKYIKKNDIDVDRYVTS
jgi:DNA-binding NtrC family response regulator